MARRSDAGRRRTEIAEAEARLGRTLPPSVREWVAFVADIAAAGYSGGLQHAHLQPVPGVPALSLWVVPDVYERFGDLRSAVLAAELHHTDPPVHSFHAELDEGYNSAFVRTSSKPEAPSVTAFALGRVVGTAAGASGFVATLDHLADLYRHLRRWSASHVEFGGCEWDEADNLLVEVQPLPIERGKFYLSVAGGPALRRDEVPEFLWRYARLSDNAHGIFAKPS